MIMIITRAGTHDTSPRDVSGLDTRTDITIEVRHLDDSNRIMILIARRVMVEGYSIATITIDAETSGRGPEADHRIARCESPESTKIQTQSPPEGTSPLLKMQ